MPRLALYTRRSTEAQVASPETQEHACREYAAKHGHEIVRVYHEVPITGRSEVERRTALPELVAALKDKRRNFDGVIVWKSDRLMRNPSEQEQFLALLDRYDCEFISVMDPVDRSTAAGRFMGRVIGAANAYEREMAGERIYAHHLAAFLKGKWPGGPKSLGLTWSRDQGRFHADDRAEDVVTIFGLYISENGNASATARALNQMGVPSPRGGLWSSGPLLMTLRNPAYRRQLHYDGRTIDAPDVIPEIVPPEIIAQTDILLQRSRELFGHARGHPKCKPRAYSGVLLCSECGAIMTSNGRDQREKKEYSGYLCGMRRAHGRSYCHSCQVSESYIDALVGRAVQMLLVSVERDVAKALRRSQPARVVRAYRGRAERLQEQRRRIVDIYSRGIIEEAEFLDRVQAIDAELAAVKDEPPTAPVMVPEVVLRALGRLAEDWPAVPTNEKRGLLLQFGAEITINTSGSQPLWAELRTTISTRVIRTEGDTLHRRRIRLL